MPYKDKKKQREYNRLWMAARRAEFFFGKRCIRCNTKKNLELDHIDPSQKVTHKIWSWSKERRLAELKKCQILCRTCHKVKSALEAAAGEDHPGSKLTNEQANEVYSRYASSSERCTIRGLAKEYGVSKTTIWSIVNNYTYIRV